MTILPKKKTSQQKTDNDIPDPNPHAYHGDRLGHQPLASETRERFNFQSRNSPPSWPLSTSRDEKRSSNSTFDEYENVENGPSHSKRRHRASPHRNIRKSHSTLHGHRNSTTQNYQNAGPSQSGLSPTHERPNSTVAVEVETQSHEDYTGYNSGDEYDRPAKNWTEDDYAERERAFEKRMRKKGFMIKAMLEDGACLFRAVADQVYGDQEMHSSIRKLCMDYMQKNSDYYSQYITEEFDKYVERKRCDHIHGNHVEMQALSEMFNRPIEVYHYSPEPINIFGMRQTDNEPIRISYHRNVHYNSIVDPFKATVGVGLGLPSFKPGAAEKTLVSDAIRASEESELEQAMLEDKLRATDWEATNEAIEEQVARESYLQWMRENEIRARKKTRTASATSSATISCAPESVGGGGSSPIPSAGRISPRNRAITPTCSPRIEALHAEEKNCTSDYIGSPKAGCSGTTMHKQGNSRQNQIQENATVTSNTKFGGFSLVETASFMNQLPPSVFGLTDWEDNDILASVLAQSQQEYLDSLKRSAKDQHGAS